MSAQPTPTMERTPTPAPTPTLKPSRRSTHLRNTWHLGVKEFHSLARDMALLFLIVFVWTPRGSARRIISVFIAVPASSAPVKSFFSMPFIAASAISRVATRNTEGEINCGP